MGIFYCAEFFGGNSTPKFDFRPQKNENALAASQKICRRRVFAQKRCKAVKNVAAREVTRRGWLISTRFSTLVLKT